MKLPKKLGVTMLTVAAAMLFAVPAYAGTYTTRDKVLTLTTPDDTWHEIHDPNTWVTLGNGEDTITLLHYSNGEGLPSMALAGDKYTRVYQTVLSTKNEVFVVTGSVVDATNFQNVKKAVESAVVNIYDTKQAVTSKNQKSAADYTVENADFTGYVISDGLNVRASYSSEAERIGGYEQGEEVDITGRVLYQNEETGWYRVDYDGNIGYVASQFISDEKPEVEKEEDAEVKRTGNQATLYSIIGSRCEVFEYSDGSWYCESEGAAEGLEFVPEGAGQWICEDGTHWTTNSPYPSEEGWDNDAGVLVHDDEMLLENNDGYYVLISELEDGAWGDADGRTYTAEGGGQWSCSDGSTWHIKED